MPLIWRVLDKEPVGSLRDYIGMGGGSAARLAQHMPPAEIIELLSLSGLRGRGGAGFPTGTKWKTIAESASRGEPTAVVINAAEGEPGTFKDRALLRTNPYRVLEGAIVAAATMETDQIHVGIKATFGREVERLNAAIAEMRAEGWLEGIDIDLVLGPSSYLFGEETGLLEVIEGRQPFPRVAPPYRRGIQDDETRSAVGAELATIGGSDGAPALVDNVETVANIPLILERGVEWFRELGTEQSPGTIVCTISGATRRSGVGEVAMGSTLREVIEAIGWGPQRGGEIQVVMAGTSNPLVPAGLLDTPLTYEAMSRAGSGLGSAGFVVFDDTTEPAAIAAGVARFLAVESCGQCEPCKSDGLFIAEQLRRLLPGASEVADLAGLQRRIGTVTVGARCNLAYQQAYVAASLLELFPQSMHEHPNDSAPAEPVMVAPIVDIVGGHAVLDNRQTIKQPDWSYGDTDSGSAPAARLGNTPVHIWTPVRSRHWPEWHVDEMTDRPLDLVDEVHTAIDESICRALEASADDIQRHIDDVVTAVETHIDVTQRVLYPMVRRVDDDTGELIADAAEQQEKKLCLLIDDITPDNAHQRLDDLAVEMHAHADIEDQVLEILRAKLDPVERSSLTDGLASAQATSTVSRLRRSRSSRAEPGATATPPQVEDARQAALQQQTAEKTDAAQPSAPPAPAAPRRVQPAPGPDGPTSGQDEPSPVRAVATEPATLAEPPARPKRSDAAATTTLLVGVDGSAASAAGLAWAGRLAEGINARVLVANVFEPTQAELSPNDYETLRATAEGHLNAEWSEPLHDSVIPYRGLQLDGPPDRLLDEADAQGASLLVVGTRGEGRRPILHMGSLAHHLAHHTRGPLAIIPAAGANADTERIVVGVDGSPGSLAAVEWCAVIASALDAEVIAVCAFESPTRRALPGGDERWRAIAVDAVSNEWIAPLQNAGVTVQTRIVDGSHPAAALDETAREVHAGMFVVGTAQLNASSNRRFVRVPLQLVHLTHLPVVMVPPSPAQPKGD